MNEERMYKIILGAHISEKATIISETANQVAFKVTKDATRPEIKQAVEKIYGVVVQGVTTLNVKGKVKRNARGMSLVDASSGPGLAGLTLKNRI
jgi:large subunit ribosomal protein L23